MSEQKLQKKIIDLLEKAGYYVIKVVIANKKGVPDIISCSPNGRFVAIEVKFGANKTSKLQDYNISRIKERNGIALVVYSLEDLANQIDELQSLST